MSAVSLWSHAVKWHLELGCRGGICSELRCGRPLALSAGLAPQSWGIWGPLGQRASFWVGVVAPGAPRWSCWRWTQVSPCGHRERGCLQCLGWGLRVGPTRREPPTPVGRVWAPREQSAALRLVGHGPACCMSVSWYLAG